MNRTRTVELVREKLLTICRDCRETPADFIFWGKLYPPEALGPKCYDCAAKVLPSSMLDEWSIRQSALIDLRPFQKALNAEKDAEVEDWKVRHG